MPFRRYAVVLAMLIAAGVAAGEALPSLTGKRVLILGDSITQDGTWVSFLAYALTKAERTVPDFVSIGLASETASGLSETDHPFPRPCIHERLGRALELIKPQVVIACYGMNDGIYHPLDDARLAAFQGGIRRLIAAGAQNGARVIVLTPPPFDPQPILAKLVPLGAPDFGFKTPFDGYAGVLAAFSRWELTLPATQAAVIDLNGPLTAYLAERRTREPGFALSGDGIHPTRLGHLLIADVVAAAFGQPSRRDRLDADLATIQTDPLFAAVAKWRATRSQGWLDHVGYTRGETVKTASVAAAETATAALALEVNRLAAGGAAGAGPTTR